HGLGAAIGAHGRVHRPARAAGPRARASLAARRPGMGAARARPLALLPTGLAAGRRVGQPVLGVEGLLPDGEDELLTAVHALDRSVLKGSHGVVALLGDRVQTSCMGRKHKCPGSRTLPRRLRERDRSAGKTNTDGTDGCDASRATTLDETDPTLGIAPQV